MTTTFARKLKILNELGICARPAAVIVKTVARFDAEVTVIKDGVTVSGKSIMGLMTLEASQGSIMEVRATGPQAREAIEALTEAVNSGFDGSWSCLAIPKEHAEWLIYEPAPPIPPPLRFLRVAFAMGREDIPERECLVRTVLPRLRQQCHRKRVRVRGMEFRKGKRPWAAAGGLTEQSVPEDEFDLPRPFFVLLCNQEARRLQNLDRVPDKIADLRDLLSGTSCDEALSNEETNTLVRCYPWDSDCGRYVLRSVVSNEEAAILDTVFRRRHGYLCEHCLGLFRAQPTGLGKAPPSDRSDCASALRKHLDDYGWKTAEYADIKSFGEIVSGTLERWVEKEGALPGEEYSGGCAPADRRSRWGAAVPSCPP